MTNEQQSAYDLLKNLFASYGLPTNSDVLDVLKNSAVKGDSAEATQIALQETATWKKRFAGNEARRKAGLNVLSVAQYLDMENQYATIMRSAGVPTGFYDDPSDFATYIGKSVSPAEVQERVNAAVDLVNREDPAVASELARRGLSKGSLVAYALDPQRALPLIRRDMDSVRIGAAAARAGVTTGVATANRLAERGVSEEAAIQGFGQVADIAGATSKLGSVYGVDYDTEDAVGEVFDGNQDAASRRRRLAGQEQAAFSGSANYGVNRSSTAGQY